jgi:creatinine amidohydrolase
MRLPIAALTCAVSLSFSQGPAAGQGGASGAQNQTRSQATSAGERGQRLEDLTWPEAERLLTADAVVVIPIGAGSKEHGPHLRLRNDLTLAEYLTRRVLDASAVVVAPTLTYHHYPAFIEYPGSTSLSVRTARDLTADVVRSLARYGPRRFYALNTGVSTERALQPAAEALALEGSLLRFTNLAAWLEPAARGLREQEGGTHADEVETSMMLYIDPARVDMSKAVKDYAPSSGPLRLTRQRGGPGTYSATGIWGDPTLATRDKGRVFVESLVAGILDDIRQLRAAPLPARTEPAPADTGTTAAATPTAAPSRQNTPESCSPGDYRTIRAIGDAFASAWAIRDAERIGGLWAQTGDLFHTDGTIERGPAMIAQNRAILFASREYRSTRHSLLLTMIRCLSADIAVADGKWDLRGVLDASGKPLPPLEGQATLVVKRTGSWQIEAYRYTVKPPASVTPTLPKRPGITDPVIR